VLDLQINSGKVESLVQGTRSKPYSVIIKIKAVNKNSWKHIKAACEGKLDSLQELLAGKFPKALGEIFTIQGKGLFPSPKEIDFSCSCPDWAYMCKHVAATLYGIGARLDEEPGLFFKLRKVKMEALVTQAVEDKTRKLLKKAKKKTARVIADSDMADMFGIDMEETLASSKKKAKTPKARSKRKKTLINESKKAKGKAATKKAGKKTASKKATLRKETKPPYDTVVGIVRRSRKGVNVASIREKTGFDDKQIRIYIYKAKRQGKIKNKSRGVYVSSNKKLA
jgi:uncharacterized Zn finger protein